MCEIELVPLGRKLEAKPGDSLQDLLFPVGVEFPCGGQGRCKGCRVRVQAGDLPASPEDRRVFTLAELAQGWRLACRAVARGDLQIELAQWEASILTEHGDFTFRPSSGLGIALDLGTTTIVAQLVDLQTAEVVAVRTALNVQAKYGADIMSRIEFAGDRDGGETLTSLVRLQIGELVAELLRAVAPISELRGVIIVGNTAMHHLFSGLDVSPLARHPFEPSQLGAQTFTAAELGWEVADNPAVVFLPCPGGFVGSDILAGVLATGMHTSPRIQGLIDLGTNGEIVFGNREGLLCASTAAGPAFEGARISMGMRAATGAIARVAVSEGRLLARVLGNSAARGICGSGLVDAVAAGLELDLVTPSGRLVNGGRLPILEPVALTQQDIRELQLAKGAIAAGVRLLLDELGVEPSAVERVFLAGAFGNYIDRASARRIGLIDFPTEIVEPVGNTALLGAKFALFQFDAWEALCGQVLPRIRHVSLNASARFHEVYVDRMAFPGRTEPADMQPRTSGADRGFRDPTQRGSVSTSISRPSAV